MATLPQYLATLGDFVPAIRTLVIALAIFLLFNVIINQLKKTLLKFAKRKRHVSNVEIFSKILKYTLFLLLILFAIFSFAGSLTGLGLALGLFTASLGFALQKPISGIAAWMMIITRRPFEIGDRVIIGTIKGDVADITLTHIYIKEVGGIVAGEELSGRIILVPNAILFEQNITNYTSKDEYVLDQASPLITYESNLDRAIKISLATARRLTKEFIQATGKEPYVRTFFKENGMVVRIRYYVPAKRMQEFSSALTQELYREFRKTKDVEIAYPHADVLLRKRR